MDNHQIIEIKKFKFSSNLEYVSEILNDKNIEHFADYENNILFVNPLLKDKTLSIIDSLNLDESEVKIDEETLEGYKEWNQNMYNPGYFTGGKTPFFQKGKEGYLSLGLICIVSGLAVLVELVNDNHFSKTFFWISALLIFLISGSIFYQYYIYKRKNN